MTDQPYRVVFVCWGNICRSPMAERMAEQAAEDAGVTGVEFTSAGVSTEESGNPIDPRAQQVLNSHGCRTDDHAAHKITADEAADADLIICMEDIHADRVRSMIDNNDHVRLLTDLDPDAEPGSGVPDPWYGADSGFDDTWAALAAAMPGILDEIRTSR
ncbi:low molecular weight protein-tyrosine-phosphatase [Propionibacteriaceae bacterium Y1700]|uniref:low molecular weight protein-tyrosine-phosphatase n=1 Tax=Microlunatus sp. Y1700 TaxID=3418487 RepID=UPI003DA7A40D